WRAAQGSLLFADQVIGCTFFWFVFFMQVKKMNVYKILFNYLSSFLFAQKGTQKGHPDCAGPLGYLALLADDGTLKTHRLRRFRQVQRLFPSSAAMLSGTERVNSLKIRF
ncbi:MAG: hypothetical protein R3297_06010, partial [Desulfobulbales bacterium]|nr:hypothetical protein [Desulfobulbales bacterium]